MYKIQFITCPYSTPYSIEFHSSFPVTPAEKIDKSRVVPGTRRNMSNYFLVSNFLHFLATYRPEILDRLEERVGRLEESVDKRLMFVSLGLKKALINLKCMLGSLENVLVKLKCVSISMMKALVILKIESAALKKRCQKSTRG
jgi:hypothetical protein